MTQLEFGQVYERAFGRTIRLLRFRGASLEHAEDIAQAAWLQGWRKLEQLRDPSLLISWINRIAINYQRRGYQKEARYQALPEFEVFCGAGLDSAPLDVAKILDSCRPRDRKLFEYQLGGLTTREIADKQGVSETAVRIRCLRARREVRASLEDGAAARRKNFQAEELAAA